MSLTPTRLTLGTRVQLVTPDNQYLDGKWATVATLTDYGAVVHTPAAASGEFRALHSEMVYVDEFPASTERQAGFTGDLCTRCGGGRMIRNGACLLCMECGESNGCS